MQTFFYIAVAITKIHLQEEVAPAYGIVECQELQDCNKRTEDWRDVASSRRHSGDLHRPVYLIKNEFPETCPRDWKALLNLMKAVKCGQREEGMQGKADLKDLRPDLESRGLQQMSQLWCCHVAFGTMGQ
ncbi:uncharacterized [Tachysurus ichikawai]